MAVVMASAGCGASAPVESPVAPSPALATAAVATSPARCGPSNPAARELAIASSAGAVLDAFEVGSGSQGVVLVPEAGARNLCGWWEYSAFLAGRGYRVLVFDHQCRGHSTCPTSSAPDGLLDDITGATATLRKDGAQRIVLMGASQGGAEVIIAGAHPTDGVVGVVALSADRLTEALVSQRPTSAAEAAPMLGIPSLFVVASDDPYVSVVDTQTLVSSVPGDAKRLVILPSGRGHGWDLLGSDSDGHRQTPDADIIDFLAAVTR